MTSRDIVNGGKDLTPEHTKRGNGLHPDIIAAHKYVHSVMDTSDVDDNYMWYGWALREAFLAGMSYATTTEGE